MFANKAGGVTELQEYPSFKNGHLFVFVLCKLASGV